MKVLELKGWPGLKARCTKCQSLVLIETDDVGYTRVLGNRWYADCCACGETIFIKEMSLPERIAKVPYERVVREVYRRTYTPKTTR